MHQNAGNSIYFFQHFLGALADNDLHRWIIEVIREHTISSCCSKTCFFRDLRINTRPTTIEQFRFFINAYEH